MRKGEFSETVNQYLPVITEEVVLQNEPQVRQHGEYLSMLYGKNQQVDKQKGNQEVDKMNNHVA